jgi:hypothetical protein
VDRSRAVHAARASRLDRQLRLRDTWQQGARRGRRAILSPRFALAPQAVPIGYGAVERGQLASVRLGLQFVASGAAMSALKSIPLVGTFQSRKTSAAATSYSTC